MTTLRTLVGDMLLDDVLARRDQLNEMLQTKLDEDHQSLGHQSHGGGDSRDHSTTRDPGCDEPPDVVGAHPSRHRH